MDKVALLANGNKWHEGDWKGERASKHRMSREAISMMNEHLIDQINATVGVDDVLWHLGDWAFAPKDRYREACEEYRNRINCKNIKFVIGNHDKREIIGKIFPECHDLVEIKISKQLIVLCHYAMAVFNKSHRQAIHLYGHSHGGSEPWMDKHMPHRRSMDVGVDNIARLLGDYRPISFDEVLKIMAYRFGHSMDHHVDPKSPTEESLLS